MMKYYFLLFCLFSGSALASNISDLVAMAATKYKVDESLIHAVIKTESAYNPSAVSHAGAVGLMQLMPGTAARYGVNNRYDPEQNIDGGVHYLKDLLGMFNNVALAVAGYNAGENAVIKYNYSIPPYRETQNYVKRVLSFFNSPSYSANIPVMAYQEAKPRVSLRSYTNTAAYAALADFYGSGSADAKPEDKQVVAQTVKPKPVGRKYKNMAAYEALAAFYGQ